MKPKTLLMRLLTVTFCLVVFVFASLVEASNWSLSEAAKPYRGSTVYVILNTHPSNDAMKPLIKEFEKLTGLKVEFELLKNMPLTRKEEIELATGTTAWDVMHLNGSVVQRFAEAGWPTPLNQFINDPKLTDPDWDFEDIFPGFRQIFSRGQSLEGDLMGVPYSGESSILFYRSDVYDRFGVEPPQTFDDLVTVCQAIDTDEIPAWACRARRGMGFNVYIWAGFLKAFGGQWFDQEMRPTLDTPAAAAALRMFSNLLNDYGPEGVANYTHYEVYTDFAQGKLGSFIDASVWYRVFNDPAKSKVVGKWAAAMVPMGPAGRCPSISGHSMMIPTATSNKEIAWLFVQWYSSKNVLLRRAVIRGAGDVTRLSVSQDPYYVEKFNVGNWVDITYKSLEMVKVPYWPNYLPEWSEIGDTVGIYLQQAILGEETPEDALREAKQEVYKIMEEAGYYD